MRLVFREVDRDKFEAARAGRKKIESRAATPKYRDIQAGQSVTIVCGRDSFTKTVKAVRYYQTAQELLQAEGFKNVLPDSASAEAAEQVYYTFPGYKEKIAEHGLVALELA